MSGLASEPWHDLVAAVQTNCHIADARHAADLALCSYLLQMREFFRWERGLPFGATLPRAEIGEWIAERERHWSALETQPFVPVPVPGAGAFEVFDVEALNAALAAHGLVYGAGLLGRDRPVFFLAELHARQRRDGLPVTVAGHELARGLAAPVATLSSRDGAPSIVVRRESLARWGWERYEAFAVRRPAGHPFHAVVQAYGLDTDFEAALPRWLDEQTEVAVLHELGEWQAGRALDPAWAELRLALPTRRGDLYARAVRDHLADLAVTLPTLLAREAHGSLHAWFAAYEGVREALFPSLADAYRAWCAGDGGQALLRATAHGRAHFESLAGRLLARHADEPTRSGAAIEALLAAPDAVCPSPR